MTHQGYAEFLKDIDAMFGRLKKAAGVSEGPMTQRDLDVLAAASADLLILAIANMREPRRGETIRGLSETLAVDVAKKREWLEQKNPNRRLDTPKVASQTVRNRWPPLRRNGVTWRKPDNSSTPTFE